MANNKYTENEIKELLRKDINKDMLNERFPESFTDLIAVQENEKDNIKDKNSGKYDKDEDIWYDKDNKGTETVFFGVTEKGVNTATNCDKFIKSVMPDFLTKENNKKTWEFLTNRNNSREVRRELARRISQYYTLSNENAINKITDYAFSDGFLTDRQKDLILAYYNTQDLNSTRNKFKNSITVQGIKRHNPALIAQSFIAKKTDEMIDGMYYKPKLDEDFTRKKMFYSKYFLYKSENLPTKDMYREKVNLTRDEIKEETKDVYNTLETSKPYFFNVNNIRMDMDNNISYLENNNVKEQNKPTEPIKPTENVNPTENNMPLNNDNGEQNILGRIASVFNNLGDFLSGNKNYLTNPQKETIIDNEKNGDENGNTNFNM